jgi:hypothetical protein
LLAIQAAFSVLPVATAFHALARRGETLRQAFHRGIDSVGRFLWVAGINFLVQAATLLVGLTCALGARRFVAGDSGATNGDLAFAAVLALTLALCSTVGAVTDLVRAASVLAPVSSSHALRGAMLWALRGARDRAVFLAFLYLGLNGLCIAAALTAGFVVGGLHVERGEGYRWLLSAAAHQGVIFLMCWSEACFRQNALRAVQAAQEVPLTASAIADTAFDSGARLDPS